MCDRFGYVVFGFADGGADGVDARGEEGDLEIKEAGG